MDILEDTKKEIGFFELIAKMTVLVFFGLFLLILVTLLFNSYFGFLDLVWKNWTGDSNSLLNSNQNTLFAIIVIGITFFSMIFVYSRYNKYFQKIQKKLFIEEAEETEHGFFRNSLATIWIGILLLVVATIITISCMAFTIGTAFSLGIFDESKLNTSGQFSILPLFLLGVTIVTLAISEAIKWIDGVLIPNGELSESEKVKSIINELLAQHSGNEEE